MAKIDEYRALITNPNVRKALDVISSAEGTTGYDTAFGGGVIPGLGTHPGTRHEFTQTDGKKNVTTAAGRYQFIQPTWNGLQKNLGLPDFGPESQDIGAIALLDEAGALNDVLAGNIESALQKSGKIWASLPSSPYAQPKRSESFIANALDSAASALLPSAQAGELPEGFAGKVAKAREAGYSDDEIGAFLSAKPDFNQKVAKAREAGYSDEEITGFLGIAPPALSQPAAAQQAEQAFSGVLPLNQENAHAITAQQGIVAPLAGDVAPVTQLGQGIRQVPRQLGLTARAAIEGVGQIPDMLLNAPIGVANWALGSDVIPRSNVAGMADALGLPTPQTATERVAQETAKLMAGAGGLMGGANLAARGVTGVAQSALNTLAANPAQQVASAAGAGLSGGSVKEAGGGAGEQAIAGLIGGLAGPAALSGIGNVARAVGRRLPGTGPSEKLVEQTVKLNVERAGMDWNELNGTIKNSLREDVKNAMRAGEEINPQAVGRLVDFRRVQGATPTRGMVSQNPVQITREQNLAKIGANSGDGTLQGLAMTQNRNNDALIGGINQMGAGAADDAYTAGSQIMGALRDIDVPRKAAVNAAYAAVRDSKGLPARMSANTFANTANDLLEEGGAALGYALPSEARAILNDVARGKIPLNVGTAMGLDSTFSGIANRMRGGASPDLRAALAVDKVRQALNNTPIEGELGQEAYQLYEKARGMARARFQLLDSPGIKAAINEQSPDRFVQEFILGKSGKASIDEVKKLAEQVKLNPAAHEAVRTQIASFLKEKAIGAGKGDDIGKFNGNTFMASLKDIGDKKLLQFFNQEEVNQLKSLGRVAQYMTNQPVGSAVNNSNTAATAIGKGVELLDKIAKLPVSKLFGVGPAVSGTISGLQSRGALNLGDSLTSAPIPSLSFSQRLQPAAMYGGLLSGASIPNRE